MSPDPPRPEPDDRAEDEPSIDDTGAFQRFYLQEEPKASKSLLYRIFVGWWRGGR